jgi:ATP-binding cassette subfamily F protein uup
MVATMAILVGTQALTKSFASRPLFENLNFTIETGERVGLIGPNGAGKSTLLSIIGGKIPPDSGSLSTQRGLRVGFLEQSPSFAKDDTVDSAVFSGLNDPYDGQEIARAQELMARLSLGDGNDINGDRPVAELSGGWKKRVALARELARQPDLLLLDEPTNHLDVESIFWLENFLARSPFATLTITHDRAFLQKISNRILELDRRNPGGLLSIKGTYADYLESKSLLMSAQEAQETRLKNTLRRETEWLRRGPKARTTKQEARIQRAGELLDTVTELSYRNQDRTSRFEVLDAGRSPKKLIEAKGISLSYAGKVVVPTTDVLITPKSRIGILGANGCGKSTLIRILLGHEAPDSGSVTHSDSLNVAYFEQNRESLDPNITVLRTVCPLGEQLDFNGTRIHVRTYLDKFLFSGNQVEMPVGRLSGGEQSRLLLARLFLEPANVLVLDEPTNDLDLKTLQVLEDALESFAGAVLVVTHDRYFLDQVASQILGFGLDSSGKKSIQSFASLGQWQTWFEANRDTEKKNRKTESKQRLDPGATKKKKLGFKEQREFDGMEATIQATEEKLENLRSESLKPELSTNAARLLEIATEIERLEAEVERLYLRWSELGERV